MADDGSFEARAAPRVPGGDVMALLQELHELVQTARPAALSTQVKIDRNEALDLLDHAIERLPDEIRAARWLIKERDEYLARTQLEADEILAAARGQAERMVQRSEVLKSAEARARRIVEEARAEAGRLRNECDDFCDQRLAHLETTLERTLGVVSAGRAKLRAPIADAVGGRGRAAVTNGAADDADDHDSPFYDQDRQ